MKIKVCGITSLEQMQQLQELDVDYLGMIFYEGSERYAEEKLQSQKVEISKLDINKVGVFVNPEYETILKAIDDYDLHSVQLHGDETDEFCLELMDKVKVIKVFRLTGEENIDELTKPFLNVCHYFMFDNGPHPNLRSTGEGATNPQPLPPLTPPTGENNTQPLLNQYAAVKKNTQKSEVSELLSSPVEGSQMGAGLYGGTGLQF
ncbi:MAG: phosphoribosylanthranilate isomerase, partial [Bacteroidota bacterium]|nr:phosphoribosylanthranilate isomerase [Bacteroidota bacterium]